MAESRAQRRLAAILAADVVGYSRLMESDETGTLERLKALRRDIIDPSIAAHSGRMVKLMGDGALVEFASAIDAVTCAVEIQKMVGERNAAAPEGQSIRFRIGINVGDIIVEGEDIYGDGVNIASRLEGMAEPGGIFISRTAADQVRDKVPIRIEDRGDVALKNIVRPIQVFCVVPEGVGLLGPAASPQPSAGATPKGLSIAVLPFANMSGDAEQEYFADGISEDIITALSKLSQLFVIARNSSFAFKGKNVNVQEVSKSLGVRYVLEGSVRKSGNRVRITAQLIDASTGGHLWAERFDRELTDIFAVQDDVTQHIVGALALNLTEKDQQRLASEHTDNLEAHDCFLRGRDQIWLFRKETNVEAQQLLKRAIDLDPGFVPPYAFLAFSHGMDYVNAWVPSASQPLVQAEQHARKAVALAERYPYGHWVLGIALLYLRRHEAAIREAERTIALSPNLAEGHESLGNQLLYSGKPEEALACFDRAMALNPYHPDVYLHFQAQALFHLGRYEDAVGALSRRLVRNPGTDVSRALLAASYGQLGRIAEAREQWDALFRINPDYSLSQRRSVLPYRNPADFELIVDGLRRVGLVE
ncbi:MAG: adenylate/guanylate cyclase domain-containing protein [Mesorhizobium sp.]